MKRIKVRFEPIGREINVDVGTTILEAALKAGVYLNASCGGEGVCGKCKVKVKGEIDYRKTPALSEKEYEDGFRLACQSKVKSDVVVEIPPESQLDKASLRFYEMITSGGGKRVEQSLDALVVGWMFNPALRKYYVELTPPKAEDNKSDMERLLLGLKKGYGLDNISVDFPVLLKLPDVLRESNWKVTSTIVMTRVSPQLGEYQLRGPRKPKLINVESGDTRKTHYSIVTDIGTTTCWGQLLDLDRGVEVATASDYNGQIKYGDDVITRIVYSQKKGGLAELQKAVVDTLNGIIEELLETASVDVRYVSHITAAGNTTMTHLLLGLNPKYIREAPYVPVANFIPPIRAKHIGLELCDHVHLYTFPCVASYVGGDIVAGVLASGMYQKKKITLYIDIGTNGEIVVGNNEWLMSASCSAGPAFEGGDIKFGMRATKGAIEAFKINPSTCEPMVLTIGRVRPKGICGSGLINIIAELLLAGIITQNGKFNPDVPTKRVREGEGGILEYVISYADENQLGVDITVSEADIDNLMRAKSAMYAGCRTLLTKVGLTFSDIEQVIIAGAFGSFIDIDRAKIIGLLPEIENDKFLFIGNGSLLGAKLISLSNEMLDDAERIARMMTNIELSEDNQFMEEYIGGLFLPHTQMDEFPETSAKLKDLICLRGGRAG